MEIIQSIFGKSRSFLGPGQKMSSVYKKEKVLINIIDTLDKGTMSLSRLNEFKVKNIQQG
jgi:hypothetical protein